MGHTADKATGERSPVLGESEPSTEAGPLEPSPFNPGSDIPAHSTVKLRKSGGAVGRIGGRAMFRLPTRYRPAWPVWVTLAVGLALTALATVATHSVVESSNRQGLATVGTEIAQKTTRQILRRPRGAQVPILAITANAFEEDNQRCVATGMGGFIAKPVEPETLYRMVLDDQPPESPEPTSGTENDGRP